ncbi:Holliday junction branch migration protein RuvA [uncultured Clostridium sp.]|uniref:Holliday junction branch migration protein RuvA n=1 Tax=uncultured Clostridium sp. TaxID=59620 RepID=UPI0028E22E75|nr:Holliday junction branch migration protein RuvA [uncultured Clostridium sp.]
MYEYIKGIFRGMNKDYIIVENGGIGYKIFTSGNTLSKTPKTDEEIILYLQQIVREDFIGLYGFHSKEERDMFNLLLTINGVGVKASLSLLSITSTYKLKYAIFIGDEKTLTKAPGIGKKTAQRIILELKDKLKVEHFTSKEENDFEEDTTEIDVFTEALAALMALGYSEKEGNKALDSVSKNAPLEDVIKECLRFLMS